MNSRCCYIVSSHQIATIFKNMETKQGEVNKKWAQKLKNQSSCLLQGAQTYLNLNYPAT